MYKKIYDPEETSPQIAQNVATLQSYGENYIAFSFPIEWDMIVVTVFLPILSQMEFNLVQKLSPRSYPIHCERKWEYSFLSVRMI